MKHLKGFNEARLVGVPHKNTHKPQKGYTYPIDMLRSLFNVRTLLKILADEMGYQDKELKYLGGGSYGLAFEVIGENKVFKITFDESEAYIANAIRRKNTSNVINYYDVRHIKFDDDIIKDTKFEKFFEDVFVIIMDKVAPLNSYEGKLFYYLTDKIDFSIFDSKKIRRGLEYRRDKLKDKYAEGDTPLFDKTMNKFIDGICNSIDECKDLGLKVTDIHIGNVGKNSDGQLVLFDLTTLGKYNYHKSKYKLKNIEIEYEKRR